MEYVYMNAYSMHRLYADAKPPKVLKVYGNHAAAAREYLITICSW